MTARSSSMGGKLRGLADKLHDALQALVDALLPPRPVPVAVPARPRGR